MIIESPLELVFRDLFLSSSFLCRKAHDVFLKLEGFNVTGSIKLKYSDRTCRRLGEREESR